MIGGLAAARTRRSVPFVSAATDGGAEPRMVVGRREVPAGNGPLLARLRGALCLGAATEMIDVATAEELVADQYGACLEYLSDRHRCRSGDRDPLALEGAHLVCTVAESSPLTAALCWGLLEFAAGRAAPAGRPGRRELAGGVRADRLAAALNDTTLVAEMLARTTSAPAGCSDRAPTGCDALPPVPTGADLEKLAMSWLPAVDGHELWSELTGRPTHALLLGWMLERYHCFASTARHGSAALAGCTDAAIRESLAHHLAGESGHGEMFRRGIGSCGHFGGVAPEAMRPLATTRLLTGHLEELGRRDRRGYVLAVAFLHLALTAARPAGRTDVPWSPDAVLRAVPEADYLVATMHRDRVEDGRADRDAEVRLLLDRLAAAGVPRSSIDAAALVPRLTLGFLDGIAEHYAAGPVAVVTRAGWSTAPVA